MADKNLFDEEDEEEGDALFPDDEPLEMGGDGLLGKSDSEVELEPSQSEDVTARQEVSASENDVIVSEDSESDASDESKEDAKPARGRPGRKKKVTPD